MTEERTSGCGWEVLTGRPARPPPLDPPSDPPRPPPLGMRERATGRGVLSWLNLMSEDSERAGAAAGLGRSLPRLDQASPGQQRQQQPPSQPRARSRTRTQELCERWAGLALDIDEILEAPLDPSLGPGPAPGLGEVRDFQPYIQSEFRQCVVPGGLRAQPLHLYHTVRNRKHALHCYEFLLMRALDGDEGLWARLCERFGQCEQCEKEGGTHAQQHKHAHGGKDPFSINSIHPDLWFLAITLKESKDKLIHFVRSELPKRKAELFTLPGPKSLHSSSFLSSYLSSFNFVEMYLDSIFKFGEASVLPKELFRCSNVRTLSLRNNFLDSVPPDIGRLSKLERLFLTNNKLQNKSIPFTIAFCQNLTELYIDNNLLDALPGIFLRIHSLERVHRHGNHNYFKATFMWYHTDVNDRILECPGLGDAASVSSEAADTAAATVESAGSLQRLAATAVIQSRLNFYRSGDIPARIKEYISSLCEGLESASSFKVFTFKNPYLGNTCVPFQHWACSLHCAREVEIPARREQLVEARLQDREYERYVRESLSRLRPSQRTLSAASLARPLEDGGAESRERDAGSAGGGGAQERGGGGAGEQISCGIL